MMSDDSRPTVGHDLYGLPYSSTGRSDGISRGIGALRDQGLMEALTAAADVADRGDLRLPAPRSHRGSSGLLDEDGQLAMVRAVRHAVAASLAAARRPLIVGGVCTALLGALAALRDLESAEPGLMMIDGHEDATDPRRSPTGESSDSELGIALGIVDGLPEGFAPFQRSLQLAKVALIGARDGDELQRWGQPSIAGKVGRFVTVEEVRTRGGHAVAADVLSRLGTGSFWLHVDLDVLGSDVLTAVDYPQPDGLSWSELGQVSAAALGAPACRGASVVIYNAVLDPDRSDARAIVAYLAGAVAGT